MKKILCLADRAHIDLMFNPESRQALYSEFEIEAKPEGVVWSSDELEQRLQDCDATLTGWGSPVFTRQMLEGADHLKIMVHAAGSVKGLCDEETAQEVLEPRGIALFSGNEAIALNVAESTLGLMIMATHRWLDHIHHYGEHKQRSLTIPFTGQFLLDATVGLISASKVARHVIEMLKPFGCRVLIYDPFLSEDDARELGVYKAELNDLFEQSNIVSIHAPSLPSTDNLIGEEQLEKLRDGAVLINTARGTIIDHEALLVQCQQQRFTAVLDVTTPEPLPDESEFWTLPNVILTPHIAGAGSAGYYRVGTMALQALRDCFAGYPVQGAVRFDRWKILA